MEDEASEAKIVKMEKPLKVSLVEESFDLVENNDDYRWRRQWSSRRLSDGVRKRKRKQMR